jgi:hypothetical protein
VEELVVSLDEEAGSRRGTVMFPLKAVPHEPGVDMGFGVAGFRVAIFVRVELLQDCGLVGVEQRERSREFTMQRT